MYICKLGEDMDSNNINTYVQCRSPNKIYKNQKMDVAPRHNRMNYEAYCKQQMQSLRVFVPFLRGGSICRINKVVHEGVQWYLPDHT